jgi:type VI secretion system secreted protein VgrG
MPITQANREISVTTPLGDDVLLFYRMSGSDQLGRLSEYRLQLLSENGDVKIADVLGKSMTVTVDLPGSQVRHFNGIVTRFRSAGWRSGLHTYEATVHSWLWLLTRSSNCRIFQDLTVLDIVKKVCNDPMYGGLIDLDISLLSGTYEAMTYCVQYRESDFNFVMRLLEQIGIYFYFRHEKSKHTMVLADSYGAHDKIEGYGALKFAGDGRNSKLVDEAILSWLSGGEIQSSSYVMNDFDFERATASTSGGLKVNATIAAAFSQPSYEMFDYPGGYVKASSGQALARARMEAIHGQCEQAEGVTSARGLFPGGLFSMTEHPRAEQNKEYLVTAAQYELVNDDYSSSGAVGDEPILRCSFTATGKENSYRAVPITPRPIVQGPQTAIVVGKAGEEIWTDEHGRIKVQFHWDRLGNDDEKSSCWVRVSQSWAGKGWGAMFIPRIGMEVVVSFLEGDPDRPLVTGCVYNSDTIPPYGLPAEQTKSTIKSNSSKGGGGFNEIRFEDKKDSEEIFIQAEKDFKRVVKNNDVLTVGMEKSDKGDQTISIKNDQNLKVGHDQIINIDNNHTLNVTGDQKVTISKTCVIEATTSIELKVGGSSIKIEPAKITIKSAEIAIDADANAEFKAGAMMKINSGAIMTIEGALVKIN